MTEAPAFVLTLVLGVLACHTLARRLERRGRAEQRRKRQANIRNQKFVGELIPGGRYGSNG